MSHEDLESIFPKLITASYQITSESTTNYNCIAWAAGDDKIGWWPDAWRLYYWPLQTRELSIDAFVKVFEKLGYKKCKSSIFERTFEKVAIYVLDSQPSHMARQLPNGKWTSKCGDFEDIEHELEWLEGSAYGRVVVIMKRKIEPK